MSKPRKLPSKKWQARYTVMQGGRQRTLSAGTFAIKTDAQDAINAALAQHRNGTFLDPAAQKVLVKDWAEKWYALRPRSSVKIRALLDARIIPYWGEWQLGDVRLMDVQTWVNEMAETLKPETVRNYYAVLKQIFGAAVTHELLGKSPCRLERHDLPAGQEGEYVFLTHDEVDAIIALMPDRYKAMIHLAAWSGLRFGELIGLQWDCVDLEAGAVVVRRAVKKDGTLGAPKNNKTRRVRLHFDTVETLRAHRRDYGGSDYVFTQRNGHRVEYANFRTRVWAPVIKQLPVKPTFHDLRHTHCSWMIAQGMDWLVLSERMGHHKPSFTMDVYGHLRHDSDDVVMAALDAARRAGRGAA